MTDQKTDHYTVANLSELNAECAAKLIGQTVASVSAQEYSLLLTFVNGATLEVTGHRFGDCALGVEFTDPPAKSESDDLQPTQPEVQLMAYLKMSLGDAANLEPADQADFLRIIRRARTMVEGEGVHEVVAKSFVADSLKECQSASLQLIGERYLTIFSY
jgi:hypothetical protein